MTEELKMKTISHMKSQLRNNIKSLEGQVEIEKNRHRTMRRYEIELHRKFALSFSIIVLFFVGAQIGAIVNRGGFGDHVVIAALLFMIYFVLITIGDGMADSFFFQAEDGIRGADVTGVQTCALPISLTCTPRSRSSRCRPREARIRKLLIGPYRVSPPVAGSSPAREQTLSTRPNRCSSMGGKIGRASCRERVTRQGAPTRSTT